MTQHFSFLNSNRVWIGVLDFSAEALDFENQDPDSSEVKDIFAKNASL